MTPFDGTMAYAQNKRQQIVMAERYAADEPTIQFATMHPGNATHFSSGQNTRANTKCYMAQG